MKKVLATLALVVACATSYSQTTNTSGGFFPDLWNGVKDSGLLTATNYAFEPYATYAPDIKSKDKWGAGALAIFNVNKNIGVGVGVDYLGRFSLVSANLELKLPLKPLAFTKWPWATNLTVTPFVLGGFGKPLSGTSSDVATIADAGAAISFGHLWGGQFNVGGAYGQWINAGDYSGKRYHIFVGWSAKF